MRSFCGHSMSQQQLLHSDNTNDTTIYAKVLDVSSFSERAISMSALATIYAVASVTASNSAQ